MTQTQDPVAEQQTGIPQPTPGPEHAWLHRLVGDWESVSSDDGGAHGDVVMGGSEQFRSIGGIWVVSRGEMRANGVSCGTSQITLGYDPDKGKFVGTWLGSMMTHLWVYEGTLDAAEQVLTLECEGPSFTDPTKRAPYRDVIEIHDDDHWTLSGRTRGEDGAWMTFMTTRYRRTGR